MTRGVTLALLAATVLACGHYGPPERHPAPEASPAADERAHEHDSSCDHEETR